MAKAKKQTRKQTQKRTSLKNAPQLPNGYKVIGRAPNWNPEKQPTVEGVRGKTKEVVLDEGTKKERTIRNFILQDDEIGAVTIWESAMLRDLFDSTDDGDTVRIEFLGFGPAKKGQNAPKLFSCGVKG